MGLYTDTSKLKWIFWTSHHSVLLIDMLLKLSKFKHQNKWEFRSANPQQPKYDKDNPNKQLPKNQSKPQEKKGHERRRRTLENGVISTKSLGTTPMNVTQNNHWWSR
jgi:hypothetical protein